MHPYDLRTMWVCRDCGRNFVFNSDVEDHRRQFSHSCMMQYDFTAGKKEPAKFTSGKVSLAFKVDGRVARVNIEYKYYPSDDSISYADVKYTDAQLQSMIEGNVEMMRNIDNYIRRLEQRSVKGPANQKCI